MSITWKRAAKLCGADTKELKDWPERLSFEQAAILAAGNRSADFTVALGAMRDAIEQGDLPAEDAERPREVRMLLREPDRFEVLAAGPCKTVAAGDVLAWLDEQGQDLGEHVRAWGKRCNAERAEYSRAFDLLCRLDEVRATAARLRDAADRTAGLERESNIRQAEVAEAEVERVRAEIQRPHELSELVPTEAKPDQGQAAPAEPQGSRQRQRHDDLALELERILASLRKQGKSTAPHAVMDALKERAGRPDSCIAASVPEGVAWTRGTGKVETLNVRALARRLKNLERRESR